MHPNANGKELLWFFMLQIVNKLNLLDLTVIYCHCPSESNEGYKLQFGAILVNLGHFLAVEASMNQYKDEYLFQNPILQISQPLQITQKWFCIPNKHICKYVCIYGYQF